MSKPGSLDGETTGAAVPETAPPAYAGEGADTAEITLGTGGADEQAAPGEGVAARIVADGMLDPEPASEPYFHPPGTAELEAAQAENAQLRDQAAQLKAAQATLQGQLDERTRQLEEAKALLADPIVEQAVELVQAINGRESEQDDIDEQLEAARQVLERRKADLEASEKELANREKAVQQVRKLAADRKAQIEALVKANEELEGRRREAKTAATAAGKRTAELESVVGRLVAEKALLQEQLDAQGGGA